MQKTLSFLAAFFEVLLLWEKQKKPFLQGFFLQTLYLQNKEKTSEKKIETFSYQFEARIPKIRQIWAKIKMAQN